MELTKQAIQKHKQAIEGLDGYIIIVSEIEDNVTSNPDMAIEACKSLIEGLCKKALELLSDEYQTTKSIRKNCDNNFPFLVKQAFENIYRNKFEIDIHNALYKVIRSKVKINKFINTSSEIIFENTKDAILKISVIRDTRGDICHGRIYPKKDESEVYLAKSIASITDGICSFMIYEFASQYITLDKKIEKLNFEDEKDFNEWLDTKYDILSVKIDYSKILFYNAYDKYEELYYSEYLLSIEDEVVEDEVVEGEVVEEAVEEMILEPMKESATLGDGEAKALYEKHFNSHQKPKEVVQLTNNFDEKTFWTENRIALLNNFADGNSFYVEGLKKIIEDYIAFDDEPLRDNIGKIMKHPPSLADRRTVLLEMLKQVLDFANDLKEK